MRKIAMIAVCMIAGITAKSQIDTTLMYNASHEIVGYTTGPSIEQRQLYIDSMMGRQKQLLLKLIDQHSETVIAALRRNVKEQDRAQKKFGEILLEIQYNGLLIDNEYKTIILKMRPNH